MPRDITGDKLKEIYFSDGKNLYSLNPAQKTQSNVVSRFGGLR